MSTPTLAPIVTPVKAQTRPRKPCPVCKSVPNCLHSPPQQMRVLLATSRRYEVAFDPAWSAAWTRVRWPHDTTHRREYKDVLREQQTKWRDAYERRGDVNRRLVALYSLLAAYMSDEERAA